MRKPRMWGGFRAMVAASIVGGAVGGAHAAPMSSPIHYSTAGTVGDAGREGPAALSFVGKERAAFYDHGPSGFPGMPEGGSTDVWFFVLGDFQVSPSATGVATRYEQTPFSVDLRVDGVAPLTLTGTLDGTVDASGRPDVWVAFDQRALMGTGEDATMVDLPLEFRVGDVVNTIRTLGNDHLGDVPTSRYVSGIIAATPVPEPAAIALLAPLAAWMLLRKRRHAPA